jgi:hypothetical protein
MRISGKLFFLLLMPLLILYGCGGDLKVPQQVCEGKKNVAESLYSLKLHSLSSFRANGQCHLQYNAEGKTHNENFPVKIFANPPAEIYLQGDVAFDPKGIILGSNEDEFWLAIRPKEISAYWWGRWAEQDGFNKLVISPKTLLEAFGVVEFDDEENWSLAGEGVFDILTKRSKKGGVVKKIYIYGCDYRVRKIEYISAAGENVIVTQLGDYKEVGDGFVMPRVIKITTAGSDNKRNSVKITLGSIKEINFVDEKHRLIFNRPEKMRGYKNVYRIIGDDLIRQQQ